MEHDHLSDEVQACTLKVVPMYVINWREVQSEDLLVAACQKWMCTRKDVNLQGKDALLKRCMGEHFDSEEG